MDTKIFETLLKMTYHHVYNYSKTTGATSVSGTLYASEVHEFNPGFIETHVARSKKNCELFCRSLFVLLSFDLRILITLLVSS